MNSYVKTGNIEQSLKEKELYSLYTALKPDIEKRLLEFRDIWKTKNNTKLFSELCFCLLTPQSKAKTCWETIVVLKKRGLLFEGAVSQLAGCLTGVRFKNNKTRYIIKARQQFSEIKREIRNYRKVYELRDWLVNNVCGLGYKEASHCLRNVGLGAEIAILDRHILKNLELFDVIKEIPTSISKRKYLEIEKKMKVFSRKIKIPIAHLDLLMWAKETGVIFK